MVSIVISFHFNVGVQYYFFALGIWKYIQKNFFVLNQMNVRVERDTSISKRELIRQILAFFSLRNEDAFVGITLIFNYVLVSLEEVLKDYVEKGILVWKVLM